MQDLRLREITEGFRGKQVGVIGDLMLDRYIWGGADRISQEAPVPVVRVSRRTAAPGGAANVVRNIVELGGAARAFGVVGNDTAGEDLLSEMQALGADTSVVVAREGRVTTEKTRVVAEHQQVVRVDSEEDAPLEAETWDALFTGVRTAIRDSMLYALIIEDYAKGLLSPERVDALSELCRDHRIPAALDPHPLNRRASLGLSILTPNRAEAFTLAGEMETRGERRPFQLDEALRRVASILLRAWEPEGLLITLGPEGMALFRPDEEPLHVATHAREVYDVSGAGDTVVASYVLARLGGAEPWEAVEVANRAAGVVVGKLGTAPVTRGELLETCSDEGL